MILRTPYFLSLTKNELYVYKNAVYTVNFHLLTNFSIPLQQVRISSWPKEKPGSWFSEFKRGKLVCYYLNMKWFFTDSGSEVLIMYFWTLTVKV